MCDITHILLLLDLTSVVTMFGGPLIDLEGSFFNPTQMSLSVQNFFSICFLVIYPNHGIQITERFSKIKWKMENKF